MFCAAQLLCCMVVAVAAVAMAGAFQLSAPHFDRPTERSAGSPTNSAVRTTALWAQPRNATSSTETGFLFGLPNPLAELGDMLRNWDDVVDDFLYKRMGNGETFYGQRQYKPSGRESGDYNGMGMSDRLRIDEAREFRQEMLERQRLARKQQQDK